MIKKQEVMDWVTELLYPYGFNKHKRKKYLWLKEEMEFTKYIKLNHSKFGNYFHVEYAFDLHALEREKQGFHHWGQLNLHFWGNEEAMTTKEISKQTIIDLNSSEVLFTEDLKEKLQRIIVVDHPLEESIQDKMNENSPYETAFDLDISIDDKIRKQLMQEVIMQGVVTKLERIHTLDELKKELQTEDEKYFVNRAVEDFFGISNE